MPVDEMRKSGEGYRVGGNLENTDCIMRDTFWIGVYPEMTKEMVGYVEQTMRDFGKEGN